MIKIKIRLRSTYVSKVTIVKVSLSNFDNVLDCPSRILDLDLT